ncbi:MAG: GIY-YIG nuclease family protein [Bacteroidetes bacterium]|nr:GIY-YIG nuclease family protein [Bacteroidota bacterium]
MYFLYILHSQLLDKFYIGHTNDPDERILRHNRGGDKFTSKGQPWILVYKEQFQTKELAYKREREIKKWKSKKLIQKLISSAG